MDESGRNGAPDGRRAPGRPTRDGSPRDWRWALGVVGRSFIVLGLLILAFVAYQLWGTGIEFRANQDDLARQFRTAVSTVTVPDRPAVAGGTGGSVGDAGATVSTDVTDTMTDSASGTVTSTAVSTASTDDTVAPAPMKKPWDVMAALTMPSISSRTLYVVRGVAPRDLKRGIGHYPGTAKPGEYGNLALAGHRTTYGAPFENIDQLRPGDRVIIDSIDGGHYEYVVESQEIIGPDDVRVLSRPPNARDAVLTLTTCHPKHSTARRLVVHARLDAAASSVLNPPTGDPLADEPVPTVAPTTLPAARPTTVPATTAFTSTTPVSTTPVSTTPVATTSVSITSIGTTSAATSTPATTAPTVSSPNELDPEADEDSVRVLGPGWFDDVDAWPQIVLWGLPLILLACAGRWLGRRWHRWWLGALAMAAPFLVVLYFFFQNVNRLLPPGL